MTSVRKAVRWLRSLDVRDAIIAALLVSDAGHAGRLFAVREASDRQFIGYLLAFCLDATSAVALYDLVVARRRSHRVLGLVVFLFAATVSGGFSLAYYRDICPDDLMWVSVLMATVAPALVALLSAMRAMGGIERTDASLVVQVAERADALERYRIEQAERTRRATIEQTERTKRTRATARVERAKVEATVQVADGGSGQDNGRGNGRVRPGELDALARAILDEEPGIGIRPLARRLGCAPSTADGIRKRVRGNGREIETVGEQSDER